MVAVQQRLTVVRQGDRWPPKPLPSSCDRHWWCVGCGGVVREKTPQELVGGRVIGGLVVVESGVRCGRVRTMHVLHTVLFLVMAVVTSCR
jgi:hypothetical protein